MIDASIPLSVKPVQTEDPLAAYGKVLQIKGAQQQQQANTQRLQEGELDLQQKQRAVAYQKTFTDSLQKHTTKNSDGSLATDWSGVQGDVTNAGYGPEALNLSVERSKVQKAALDQMHAQNVVDADRIKAVGSQLGALPQVDESATPEVQAVQKAAFNAAAPTAIANLVQGGHMSKQQGAQIIQTLSQSGGWTPQIGAYVKQTQLAALDAQQQVEHVQKGLDAARQQKLDKLNEPKILAETAKVQGEVADKATSDAAAALSNSKDKADYAAKLAKLDPKIADKFDPNADPADPAMKEKILTAGMNADQLARHQESKLNGESLRAARDATQAFREESLAFRKEAFAEKKGALSKEAEKAKAKALSLDEKEAPLWAQARQIDDSLSKGAPLFIPEKGQPIGIKQKAQQDGGTIDGLISNMRARRESIKDTLRDRINEKFDLIEQAGGNTAGRERALAGVERIGKPSEADTEKAAQTPGTKTVPPANRPPLSKFDQTK